MPRQFGSPAVAEDGAGHGRLQRAAAAGFRASVRSQERGDPQATAEAVLKIVDAENPPLRLILGSTGLPMVRAAYADRLATWEEWKAVSNAAQGEPQK